MDTYHKIQSVYKREPKGKRKFIEGVYSIPEFKLLKNILWECTEKVDGTNIRVGWENEKVTLQGRTDNSLLPAKLVSRLDDLFISNSDLFRKIFGDSTVCLYGEGYGAKIQKGGGLYSSIQDFVLFDVKIDGLWLRRPDVNDIAEKMGISAVPVLFSGTLDEIIEMVKHGIISTWGNFLAEGVVARPIVELQTRLGDRVITKVKHRDF